MRRVALLGLIVAALAGCEISETGELRFAPPAGSAGSGGRGALSDPAGDAEPIRAVSLVGGDVVLAAPRGYCVDPVTVETDDDGAFAMLASCRILTGSGPDVAPAVVTVTVGPRDEDATLPPPEALARLAGAPARAAATRGGLVTAQMQAGGSDVLSGGDPRYWRGAFRQGGRLVSLAVYAPDGSDLAASAGRRFLEQVRRAIETASARSGSAANG
ncbi:hypothetical protein ROJ8625_00802 [Roseivivax jejudonensis]|uniref:Uncharacterized protein n=1 Tax=Roseivivax jejudonensis TaxID=1529041 RepID=A0A1X6YH99_9RHOB|nr:hypothetical protein [Roseivivax jejudonensis]SLN21405.1 hypothetical protein ROJ8625_00802 [Roseivivax jejudonensis]